MERVYTVSLVERLLRSYLDINETLMGRAQQGMESQYITPEIDFSDKRYVPLGMTKSNPTWPFRDKRHARSPRDGKARARRMEDLHCAVLDIETALNARDESGRHRITDDDFFIITQFYILQMYTLEELCLLRNVTSRGSMQRRCQRAVARLVDELERPKA